jgi:ABC-type transport system substrate-binding protein
MDRSPRASVDMALFNMEHPVVGGYSPAQIALRRAISLAYNVQDEIRLVRKGQSIPSQSPVSPLVSGFDASFVSEMSAFAPARARALLDTYGFVDRNGDGWRERPDGSPLKIEMATQPDQLSRALDEIWKKSYDAVRVQLSFKTAKWPEQLKMARNGQYMVWHLGLSAGSPDSSGSFRQGYGPSAGAENLSRFRLDAYDAIFREQEKMPDGPERLARLRQLQQLLLAYAPMFHITHRYAIDMSYPWVQNYRRWPFARNWWLYVDLDVEAQRRGVD